MISCRRVQIKIKSEGPYREVSDKCKMAAKSNVSYDPSRTCLWVHLEIERKEKKKINYMSIFL